MRFLRVFVFGWAGLLAVAAASGAESYAIYVTNEVSDDVTVIDGSTLKAVATFPVGKRPRGIEVIEPSQQVLVAVSGSPRMGPGADPERARTLKADKAADGVAVVPLADRKVARKLSVGSDPEEFAVSADGKRLFVANEDAGEASAWEIETGINLWTSRVSDEPEGVAVNPNGAEVIVGCEEASDIYILDTLRGKQLARIPVGKRPRTIVFSKDARHAYVALEGEAAVAVIDVAGRCVEAKWKLEPGMLPMGIVASADGKQLFVTTGRAGKLAVVQLENGAVSSIAIGKRPWGAVLSPDGKRLFTANGPSNDVSVVDVETLKEIARVPVGSGPWGVAVGPKL